MPAHVLSRGEPTPAVFDAVLPRLRVDARQLFGTDVRLQPVAYELRPFSHLLRLAVWREGAAAPLSHCFLKIFKPKPVPDGEAQMRLRVEHDYATNRRIHDGLVPFPRFGAVRPLACYPDALAIVTEEATGETLLAHLERRAAWFPPRSVVAGLVATMAAAGQWLRAFQTIEPPGEPIA